jgi:hypothetical protein
MTGTETPPQATDESGKPGKNPRRAPGVGFPSMPLGEAVTLIKKIASYGNTHTDAAIASFLGHSTANSGPFRTKVAALRDYGLLAGRGSDLSVTELALEIVHPGLDANPAASLRAAFMKCKLFATVLDALPKDVDLETAGLANTAMHNHGVASQSKDAFAASFVKSGVLAGLVEEVDAAHVRILAGGANAPATDPEQQSVAEDAEDQGADRQQRTLSRPLAVDSTKAVVSHAWPINGGFVRFTIESSKTLPASAYGVIGTVIEAGDKLAAMLAVPESMTGPTVDPE